MMFHRIRWLLVGIFCVALSIQASAQETQWEKHIATGTKAYEQGRYADAEKSFLAALGEVEQFDLLDLRLATTLNNLAALYDTQGRYAEAEPLYHQALGIFGKTLGPEHFAVATILNNLALLYSAQARNTEAELLLKQAVAIDLKSLGPQHPDVATDLNNLAEIYREQGKYAEAEALHKQVLAIREKSALRYDREKVEVLARSITFPPVLKQGEHMMSVEFPNAGILCLDAAYYAGKVQGLIWAMDRDTVEEHELYWTIDDARDLFESCLNIFLQETFAHRNANVKNQLKDVKEELAEQIQIIQAKLRKAQNVKIKAAELSVSGRF